MKIGPIQEQWLQSLEQHPERQMRHYLGERNEDGSYQACCLGEYLIVYCEATNQIVPWDGADLADGSTRGDYDGEAAAMLTDSYDVLGLHSPEGYFRSSEDYKHFHGRNSLATMNDSGISWPEIARYIREHPEAVFTHAI